MERWLLIEDEVGLPRLSSTSLAGHSAADVANLAAFLADFLALSTAFLVFLAEAIFLTAFLVILHIVCKRFPNNVEEIFL